MSTAYDRAMALRLAEQQREQRATAPRKIAQKLLREWCGKAAGWGAAIDPMAAARLVEMVEAVVVAERACEQKVDSDGP
jgi:hypothetical protein